MTAYYNEIDPFAAQWLRNLVAAKLIAPGEVDERSIEHVQPEELRGFLQCHFFAGIGIWSHALRSAGWDDNRPVWTGSCPCQPFSQAGAQRGFDDPRHLWPAWFRLIGECRPDTIFGEQVEGPAGRAWLDAVCADLEGADYAIGASVLCSAGVGAPNIRQRIYWMAHAESGGCGEHGFQCEALGRRQDTGQSALGNEALGAGRMEQPNGQGRDARELAATGARYGCAVGSDGGFGGLGDASGTGLPHAEPSHAAGAGRRREGRTTEQPSGPCDPWRILEWIGCLDGKARPTQPGLFPLAPRHTGDVGVLRGAGNAINAVLATEFIAAAIECLP